MTVVIYSPRVFISCLANLMTEKGYRYILAGYYSQVYNIDPNPTLMMT